MKNNQQALPKKKKKMFARNMRDSIVLCRKFYELRLDYQIYIFLCYEIMPGNIDNIGPRPLYITRIIVGKAHACNEYLFLYVNETKTKYNHFQTNKPFNKTVTHHPIQNIIFEVFLIGQLSHLKYELKI
jgi:hypothetical protein